MHIVRQDIGNVSNVRRNGGGTTRGNVWGDVGFASGIVTPPSFPLHALHSFYTNANAFQLWLHYVYRNTMPRWQPRTTLYYILIYNTILLNYTILIYYTILIRVYYN